ncbi:MAG: UDP-glucose 4-epimerase GalE [Chloroflexi bacterium]|nr:UDP-glucose 4-epimerase GalE [Chloroflexota bacterium]
MRVLVTGGAGYIGSVVVEELLRRDHEVVVYDSLYKGHRQAVAEGADFIQGDLLDTDLLRATLSERGVEAAVHMAADSLVGESVEQPGKYYRNNVVASLNLANGLVELGITRLVLSSTAAVYGEPAKQPIEESDPTGPTNTYGETKLAFERALHWYGQAHGLRYASLRYFNAAGASAEHGEDHTPESHLIPIVLQTAAGQRPYVTVFGDDYPTRDGTCVRDYIHVVDLARAHVLALEALHRQPAPAGAIGFTYNLGRGGGGYTVREVIDAARRVTGRDIPVQVGARRAGDPAVLVASSERIRRELGWRPERQDLGVIVESAWRWLLGHPHGYGEALP